MKKEMKKEKTFTGAVIYHIIVNQHKDIPKLFVTNIPQMLGSELKNYINEAGYIFDEFNIRWANHSVVVGLQNQDSFVRNQFLKGDVETISYEELMERVQKAKNVN